MSNFSASWDRFCETQLGDWSGRALVVSKTGKLLHSGSYTLSTSHLSRSRSNPAYVVISQSTLANPEAENPEPSTAEIRYDTEDLHVFDDGSFTASHRLLSLPRSLSVNTTAIPFAIEHVLVLSATERVRVFLTYDAEDAFDSAVFLEEARDGLFENRPPLAFTSILGQWSGIAESLQRTGSSSGGAARRRSGGGGFGFGRASPKGVSSRMDVSPSRDFSEEDLPQELQHPSRKQANGLMRFRTSVRLGWDPATDDVRRTTVWTDMQGVELGTSTVYGEVVADKGSLFDVVSCSDNSLMLTLSNGCWLSTPLSRSRGVPGTSELGCLVTPSARRRCLRTYGAKGLASELLITESHGMPSD